MTDTREFDIEIPVRGRDAAKRTKVAVAALDFLQSHEQLTGKPPGLEQKGAPFDELFPKADEAIALSPEPGRTQQALGLAHRFCEALHAEAELDYDMSVSRLRWSKSAKSGDEATLDLSSYGEDGWVGLLQALALVRSCQEHIGAGAVGFVSYDCSESARSTYAYFLEPGKKERLRLFEAEVEDETEKMRNPEATAAEDASQDMA